MHDHHDDDYSGHQDDLLDDLEFRCTTNVAAVRERPAASRARVDAKVYAGDVCAREGALAEVQASDLRASGMRGLSQRPLMVGSVFQLRFDAAAALPAVLAVCERCAMLNDDSFELRFRFATPIASIDS